MKYRRYILLSVCLWRFFLFQCLCSPLDRIFFCCHCLHSVVSAWFTVFYSGDDKGVEVIVLRRRLEFLFQPLEFLFQPLEFMSPTVIRHFYRHHRNVLIMSLMWRCDDNDDDKSAQSDFRILYTEFFARRLFATSPVRCGSFSTNSQAKGRYFDEMLCGLHFLSYLCSQLWKRGRPRPHQCRARAPVLPGK